MCRVDQGETLTAKHLINPEHNAFLTKKSLLRDPLPHVMG